MRRLYILIGVITLSAGHAAAQQVDARAAVEASITAMGADSLKTVEYSGAGFTSLIGQQYAVEVGWPTIEVASTN